MLAKVPVKRIDGKSSFVASDEPAYAMELSVNAEPDTRWLRYDYTSLTTPNTTYDVDVASGERKLLKRDPVLGGYDPANYVTERVWADARDGTKVDRLKPGHIAEQMQNDLYDGLGEEIVELRQLAISADQGALLALRHLGHLGEADRYGQRRHHGEMDAAVGRRSLLRAPPHRGRLARQAATAQAQLAPGVRVRRHAQVDAPAQGRHADRCNSGIAEDVQLATRRGTPKSTMSSSSSGSSGSIASGAIVIALITRSPETLTVTVPPPAEASTSSCLSASWAASMSCCIFWTCFIIWSTPPAPPRGLWPPNYLEYSARTLRLARRLRHKPRPGGLDRAG